MPFRAPTRLDLAPGALRFLPDRVAGLGCHRLLLVTDEGVLATGLPARVADRLRAVSITVEVATEVESNPRTHTAEGLARRAVATDCAGVLGIGGGSVIDAAKAAAMLATNGGGALDYVGCNRFESSPLPFIAVPTTCGTGSEVTWVSVLTDPSAQRKVSLKGDRMFPDVALVDSEVLATLPPALLATTAVDALTHAIEATTCSVRNPVSDGLAEQAVALAFAFLPRAYRDVMGDGEARAAVMQAATLAGLAFGSADVAAVHCLSEALGGLYDVPHGLANAVLLVPTLAAHGGAVARRLAELDARVHGEALGDGAGSARFLRELTRLLAVLEIPSFRSLDIPLRDHARIAAEAVANGSNGSNPRPMRAPDYQAILAAALA